MGAVEGSPELKGTANNPELVNIGDSLLSLLPYKPANKHRVVDDLLQKIGLEAEMTQDELLLEVVSRYVKLAINLKKLQNSDEALELSILLSLLDSAKNSDRVEGDAKELLANTEELDIVRDILPDPKKAFESLLSDYQE